MRIIFVLFVINLKYVISSSNNEDIKYEPTYSELIKNDINDTYLQAALDFLFSIDIFCDFVKDTKYPKNNDFLNSLYEAFNSKENNSIQKYKTEEILNNLNKELILQLEEPEVNVVAKKKKK